MAVVPVVEGQDTAANKEDRKPEEGEGLGMRTYCSLKWKIMPHYNMILSIQDKEAFNEAADYRKKMEVTADALKEKDSVIASL
ncbi:hypothetical protein Dimus_028679 [Dionaea muscipula]